jgi:hypothetical protein
MAAAILPQEKSHSSSLRAAIYARVSTANNGQDPRMQTRELGEFCERRGWTLVEYVDIGISGTKEKRPALDRLMADAYKRQFDVVVVWRFDRFAQIRLPSIEGPGDVPGPRDRVREPFRADGHVHAHREDGLHSPGRRGRTGAEPNRGAGPSWDAQCLRKRQEDWPTSSYSPWC